MRNRREEMGLDQYEFATLMRNATDDPRWKQQKVSRLENRETKFRDDDLKDVAEVQGMPYAYYFDGPEVTYRKLREAGLASVTPISSRKRENQSAVRPASSEVA